MFDSLINYFDKFGPELLVIQFGFLVILSTLFLWLWFSNRRKYHNLKHAIPANVVKSYLDSIIQNSTALKSQLFRGGGLDVAGGVSIPSVMPLSGLMGGDNVAVSGAPSTAMMEELNQRRAELAALQAQLAAAQSSLREVEPKLSSTQGKLTTAEQRIKELEDLLAKARAGGGGGGADPAELASVTKERNEYRDRLKEFEIIADDLANLKRLQQENEQLKRSLNAAGGNIPLEAPAKPAPAPAPASDVSDFLEDLAPSKDKQAADNKALEDFLGEPESNEPKDKAAKAAQSEKSAPEISPEEEMAQALNAANGNAAASSDKPKSDKTPEDLLSEFEKMLG